MLAELATSEAMASSKSQKHAGYRQVPFLNLMEEGFMIPVANSFLMFGGFGSRCRWEAA